MADMRVSICGVEFKNPVITASGTFGFGREYNNFYPISRLGGVSIKGTTLHERPGNPPPRIAETPGGILNSVGLQNPGVDEFIETELPWLKEQDTVVIANVAGTMIDDYCETARRMCGAGVDMVELNISCPNVKHGGAAFGVSCSSAAEITSAVKKVCTKPLIVKLSPNVTDIAEIARSVEAAGADAVSLINTLTGMKIDIKTRRPVLRNNIGGMSGPCVLPLAVRMVWQTANAVNIPVIGMGGVAKWQDAVELMLAGACAVQVGTANFTNPYAPLEIIDGLNDYCDENGIEKVSDITGKVQIW